MKIETVHIRPYEIPLTNGPKRVGILMNIIDANGNHGWGEIAPLPNWSQETLDDALSQVKQKLPEILNIDWTASSCFDDLIKLQLLPAVSFGLESALLSILAPISEFSVATTALLMGSPNEILQQADLRFLEGYVSAKLKVGHLSFEEATHLIQQLKDKFRLRIDVNRAWKTSESLSFFAQFPLESFDYVEEPFQNPHDLGQFQHPLAVDESFPHDLSLEQLELLPTLKALIYKPTLQGGMLKCLALKEWALKRGVSLVLSSSFESDLGLAQIASIAHRLALSSPIGIGTYDYLNLHICHPPLRFFRSYAYIPSCLKPKTESILI